RPPLSTLFAYTTLFRSMRFMASGKLLGIPSAIFVWALVSVVIAVILTRTGFGRSIYATGSREAAAYLSGIRTRLVIVGAFVCSRSEEPTSELQSREKLV